jgi:uncharacterized membrane protein YciS (DUF1049 family)
MWLVLVIIGIAILSVILAALSLKSELKKTQEEVHVKKELQKGKVLFYSSDSDSA